MKFDRNIPVMIRHYQMTDDKIFFPLIDKSAALFVAGPIVVEHQAFAAHHPPYKASSDSLRGVGYGPCFQENSRAARFCRKNAWQLLWW
jgi:hypothetical protein